MNNARYTTIFFLFFLCEQQKGKQSENRRRNNDRQIEKFWKENTLSLLLLPRQTETKCVCVCLRKCVFRLFFHFICNFWLLLLAFVGRFVKSEERNVTLSQQRREEKQTNKQSNGLTIVNNNNHIDGDSERVSRQCVDKNDDARYTTEKVFVVWSENCCDWGTRCRKKR